MRIDRPLLWKFLQSVARILSTLLFDLKVYGQKNVPARGGVLIVSNHQSSMDPVILAVRLRRPLNFSRNRSCGNTDTSRGFSRSCTPFRCGRGWRRARRKETIQRLQEGHLMNVYPKARARSTATIAPLQKGVLGSSSAPRCLCARHHHRCIRSVARSARGLALQAGARTFR